MNNIKEVRNLFKLMARYKLKIIVIFVCLLLSSVMGLFMPFLSSKIMDEGFIQGNFDIIFACVMFIFGMYILSAIFELIKEKERVYISTDLKFFLEEKAYIHIMKLKVSYFKEKNSTELINMLKMDIDQISSIAEENIFFVITQIFGMVGGIVGLFILEYRLTIMIIFFIPVKYFVMKIFAKKLKENVDLFLLNTQEFYGWYGDAVDGIQEIKLFNLYNSKTKEFKDKRDALTKQQKKISMLAQWNSVSDSVIIQFMVSLIYIIGAKFVLSLEMTVGNIFAFITYSVYVTAPISAILNIGYYFAGIFPSIKRYREFMEWEEENTVSDSDENEKDYNGDLCFDNVSFAYDGKRNVLQDVSFSIPYKSKVAIIGTNGAGKSTIISLLLRLYDSYEGKILINKKNILEIPLEKYRNMFSVVSQNIYLFNDTIRNNIALYKEISDEEVLNICDICGLLDFVSEVTLDYKIGQNGVMLSGGQRQKIALARALAQDRPYVILDEVTSAADKDSEKKVAKLLKSNFSNKTVIVISHRLELLQEIDEVIQL